MPPKCLHREIFCPSENRRDLLQPQWLSYSSPYVYKGQIREAEPALQELTSYCENFGCEQIRPHAYMFLAIVMIDKGHLSQGLKMLEEERQLSLKNERKILHAMLERIIGKVYLQVVRGEGPKGLSFLAKNIGFLMKDAPLICVNFLDPWGCTNC